MKTECQNCGRVADADDVIPIEEVKALFIRVAPGEPMPAGECRVCGALVHKVAP